VLSLAGKRLLITGVLTKDSIGYAVCEEAQRCDAEIVVTSFGRAARMTARAVKHLERPVDILELDVTQPDHFDAVARELEERWGVLDGVLHSIAFAPGDALGGQFLDTPPESALQALQVSAISLNTLCRAVLPLLERADDGASVVGLDFDASLSWPAYDWMGVAKSALESVSRYLARYVGPRGIRVNLVSAGPLATPAASGIPGFSAMADTWASQAPLGWNAWDPTPVARAACFLLSDAARGITGEILHVDGGRHAMAGPVDTSPGAGRARESLASTPA
jgi:enoyl ACP reductase